MTPERWQQIREVLEKALELAPEQRSAFLGRACASDTSLRQEVATLLASNVDVRSSFLQSPPARLTLLPGTKLGDYEIKSVLGVGGMGEVYRARDPRLGRDVAIKVLPALLSTDTERLHRFEQEARAAAALNHPNILAVFRMGTHDGSPYLVSELLEGETLREQLTRGRLLVRKAIEYGVQVARGLAAAHEKGIVHRDLKPENLFVTRDERVKILDFGLAKLTQAQPDYEHNAPTVGGETEPGTVMGTVGYMSPEQVRGQPADHRTDIFSFGAILYEMLAGRRAFQRATAADTQSAILNEDPPLTSQVTTNIPPALQRVVHRCLEKNAGQRFQSAADLGFALDSLSEGSGPLTPPSQAGAGATRLVFPTNARLKWALMSMGTVVLIALASGLAWRYSKRIPNVTQQVVQRQLTASTPDNPIPGGQISRDGNFLAYSDSKGIAIEQIANGEIHRVPRSAGLLIADWFPDNLRLLVGDDNSDLWALSVLSGEKHKLAPNVYNASLSRDGSQILFTRRQGREMLTMPAEGGTPQSYFSLDPSEQFEAEDFSPDEKSIADIRVPNGQGLGTLEIRSLTGGQPRVLITDTALIGGGSNSIVWLPDGRILFGLYKTGSSNESDLWVLSPDMARSTANPVRLTNTTGSYIAAITVSRDGKRLAVTFTRYPFSVFLAGLNRTSDRIEEPVRITNDSWNNWPRAWSPDGQTLFFFAVRSNESLYKKNIQSDTTELFASNTGRVASAAMTPDGDWLIACTSGQSDPTKARQLLRYPVSGSAPESILPLAGEAEVQCAFSGARTCILSEMVGKQTVFYTLDPIHGKQGELARLDTPGQLNWRASPDGSRISIVETPGDSVRILELRSGQSHIIYPIPPQTSFQDAAWSYDGRRLFVTAFPDSSRGRLLEMDLDGHTRLLLENNLGWVGDPLPSPDGRHIAFLRVVTDSNVTLLENF
jgi:Tol biopolymer transport system component